MHPAKYLLDNEHTYDSNNLITLHTAEKGFKISWLEVFEICSAVSKGFSSEEFKEVVEQYFAELRTELFSDGMVIPLRGKINGC